MRWENQALTVGPLSLRLARFIGWADNMPSSGFSADVGSGSCDASTAPGASIMSETDFDSICQHAQRSVASAANVGPSGQRATAATQATHGLLSAKCVLDVEHVQSLDGAAQFAHHPLPQNGIVDRIVAGEAHSIWAR